MTDTLPHILAPKVGRLVIVDPTESRWIGHHAGRWIGRVVTYSHLFEGHPGSEPGVIVSRGCNDQLVSIEDIRDATLRQIQ